MEDSVQELIAGCRKRHRQSQLAMYRRFAPLVYPICLRIVGHSEEAEEAMQDTFLKLFEKLDQYHDELCFEACCPDRSGNLFQRFSGICRL